MEKRKYPRHDFHGNVRLEFNQPQWGWEGKTHFLDSRNISEGGIMLRTEKPCPSGESCDLFIRWGLFALDIPLPGLVIRSDVSSLGTSYETAVQFEDMDNEQKESLKQLMESCVSS